MRARIEKTHPLNDIAQLRHLMKHRGKQLGVRMPVDLFEELKKERRRLCETHQQDLSLADLIVMKLSKPLEDE